MVRLLRKQGAAGEACDRTGPQHQGEPELGHTGATGDQPNGSLLRREIQVQWPASTDRVKQHRKLGWRGRL
jgi:hypothetical protein